MAKDTFYFSHDFNSRQDEKIKKLIRKHKMHGYGIFWAIIEDLYNNANDLEADYEGIAFDYHTDENTIKSIIEDFDLFVIDGNNFGSKSVERRLDERNEKSSTASKNAFKRWSNDSSRIKADKCIFYIINIYDENESFLKCGITTESISRRYSGKLKNYSYSIIYNIDIALNDALEIEKNIQKSFNNYIPKNKFGGYLECYSIEDKLEIINFAMQCECKGNAIKERKEKKGKELNEKKESKENEIEILLPAQEILIFLNETANRAFDFKNKNSYSDISARLKEGYTSDELKEIIQLKTMEWINDDKMRQYLTPSTLFSAKNCNKYKEQVIQAKINPQQFKNSIYGKQSTPKTNYPDNSTPYGDI
jgi:uncharacterized phage protein (TIGR02220 family)